MRQRQRDRRRARGIAVAALVAGAALVVAVALVPVADTGVRRDASAAPAHPRARAHPRRRPASVALPRRDAVRGSAARRMPVPILMYHVIGTPAAGAAHPRLWVTPAAFGAQMRALRRAGYRAITIAEAFAAWRGAAALPARPLVVSFDDGYLGDYTHALPVLRSLGWPGVLNLELDNVAPGDLTAHQVRALVAAGWELDSHTLTHPDLTTVSGERLARELAGSRRALRRRFGVRADFLCYPSGRFDAAVVAAARAAGYRGATTTIEGYAVPGDPFTLARIRVSDTDSPAGLLRRLDSERPSTAPR